MTPTQALRLLGVPAALCQTSTVIVVPTPQPWDGALSRCLELGYSIYPVPATPTDPVYAVLQAQPGDRYCWHLSHSRAAVPVDGNRSLFSSAVRS